MDRQSIGWRRIPGRCLPGRLSGYNLFIARRVRRVGGERQADSLCHVSCEDALYCNLQDFALSACNGKHLGFGCVPFVFPTPSLLLYDIQYLFLCGYSSPAGLGIRHLRRRPLAIGTSDTCTEKAVPQKGGQSTRSRPRPTRSQRDVPCRRDKTRVYFWRHFVVGSQLSAACMDELSPSDSVLRVPSAIATPACKARVTHFETTCAAKFAHKVSKYFLTGQLVCVQ